MKPALVVFALFTFPATGLHAQDPAGDGQMHPMHDAKSSYLGDEKREIKALSAEETSALLNGEGMGMARAAELNHFPGPRHVLDLAGPLGLTEAQRTSVQKSFNTMHGEAARLGRELVEKERALDAAFVSRSITPASLKKLTEEIEVLRGRLRYTHLAAHVAVRAELTPEQIASYDRLRGYSLQR